MALSLGGLGFLPQLGGPGYDSALIAGLVLPVSVGVVTALLAARAALPSPFLAVVRGCQLGLLATLLLVLFSVLHGVRAGFCDPLDGVWRLLLGPGFGAVLNGALAGGLGWLLSLRQSRRFRAGLAVALGVLPPLCGVIASLLRFYTSPMVFAYDPFAGHFAGPLYDTVTGPLWPLVTYRLGTLGTLTAVLASSGLLLRGERGVRVAWAGQSNRFVVLFAALVASLANVASGAELGHFSTSQSIAEALGRRLSSGRCDVIYSSAIPEPDARRVGGECQAHLTQIERFFEVRGPERVSVWLFANDSEKGRLMGAQRTYIAKPWRDEVYVQAAGFPHPVLGHELAHVVSRSFGVGPFRIAGMLGGLVPDPGRIEGIASAASPSETDTLTQEEWAAAMLRLGLLPPLENLFQFGFFGHNASRAYTAAGAFVQYFRRSFGAAALRSWYAGAALEQLTQQSLPELSTRWRQALSTVPLTEAALKTARARFESPAFFERTCPRIIDRIAGEANARLASADIVGAVAAFQQVLQLDPHDSGARLGLAACSARSGALGEAERRYAAIQQAADSTAWARVAAREARADVLLRAGQFEAARQVYAEIARDVVDEDRLRTLDVKQATEAGIARDAILALLIGDELGPSWDVAAAKLGEWSTLDPGNGLADYLLAKNLYNRGRFKEAALYVDRALSRALPEPRVRDEALRLRLLTGCATVDVVAARWAFEALQKRPLTAARREGVARLAERCHL